MRAKEIFLGANGLRAGWRLAIFLAIMLALQAALQGLLYAIVKARRIVVPEGLHALFFIVSDSITLLVVVLTTAVMARWERRKLADYGLPGKSAFGWRFWEGAAFGF